MVATTMNTKMKPNKSLRKSFTSFVLSEIAVAIEIYGRDLDVKKRDDVAQIRTRK